MNPDSQSLCAVLYVDDEEKALKYFRMAFAPKFEIFTASSPAEGLGILERESAKIGIVLSDQRMPDMLGADFLGTVRELHPGIVRILTTAYSDLESAISAVNRGHIYQYVVKPWDITDLGMVLQRAADYYRVLSERDALLALKMTTLQRILCSDRVKWLLLHARSREAGGQAAFVGALVALIRALPESLNPVVADADSAHRRFEISGLIRAEYTNATGALDILDDRSEAVAGLPDAVAAALAGRPGAVCALAAALGAETGVDSVAVDADGTGLTFTVNLGAGFAATALTSRLFGVLTEREIPALGVTLLKALISLVPSAGTLRIVVGDDRFEFAPAGETDSASEAIDALYEKFTAADISRL